MEHITMSRKELEQLKVFEKLKNRMITPAEAALQLEITERWVRTKFKRYLSDGNSGLVHKNRGRASPNSWCKKEQGFAIELLQSEWNGFGPTFAAEKLKELHDIKVSKETLRNVMIQTGVWQAKQKRKRHRNRRERRPMVGIMVQLDGSIHDWFEGRGPVCTLLVFIDDATSKILWLEFVKSENHIDAMRATKHYVELYGRPHEFYVDFGKVFSVNLNNPERDKKTQWERAVEEELSIKVLHAHSPQAKGRVERSNGTLQDRLIKEMRLAKVSSIQEANKFLADSDYIQKHNNRFAVPSASAGDAHRPIENYDLNAIFCLKEERILTNDYTIAYNKQIFQLDAQQPTIIGPKNSITVNTHLNGAITLSIRKVNLTFKEVSMRSIKTTPDMPMKDSKPRTTHPNSKRWAAGLLPRAETPARVG